MGDRIQLPTVTEPDDVPAGGSDRRAVLPDGGHDAGDATPDVDPFRIESRLTSHGIYVTDLSGTEAAGYRLRYESMAADGGTVPHRELGRVINVFLDVFGEDWTGTDLEATVLDLEGNEVATWHVEESWLSDLATDDLSEVEFSRLVVDTLEPADR